MQTQQWRWSPSGGWAESESSAMEDAHLVFLFGSPSVLQDEAVLAGIKQRCQDAHVVGCSTAGEILGTEVQDDSAVATAVHFDHTAIEVASHDLADGDDGTAAGKSLASALPQDNLRHVMVFSDGLHVNGSALVAAMKKQLPGGVQVTGGLAGDGARFGSTVVVSDAGVKENTVTVLGLYGDSIHVGYGSLGGWDSFGPRRQVTRSDNNVLYELDGQPALELYKQYLGDKAEGLPATGLLFPLSVQMPGRESEVVRTILAVDDGENSLTFAGDLPEGSSARLMKANFDRLVDGAQGAAKTSHDAIASGDAQLAILISCVGRKLVLQQRVEEEVEAVRAALGDQAAITGFYSYGEICPAAPDADCELHNQTMTITTLRED